MFEDPELQDPLSLSLNENYNDQNSHHHDSKRAQASPEYNCETPEIQVIIKEEEDGWTVSENYESFSTEGPKEDSSTHHPYPALTSCGRGSSVSYGEKRRQSGYLLQRCSAEPSGSSAGQEQQRHAVTDSEEKPHFSRTRGKTRGNEDQCNNTIREPAPILKRGVKSSQRSRARAEDRSRDVKQNTSLQTEAEEHETKRLAPYQTECPGRSSLITHGTKRASANVEDQTLHLTVRLQSGEEEEEQEEEQDEEIGGLINSDGEVVEWDARESPDRGSDCTESPRGNKVGFIPRSKNDGEIQRESKSPTLLMEVVSGGEDEEREEGEDKERIVKLTPTVLSYHGKRARRKKTAPETPAVSLEAPVTPVKKKSQAKEFRGSPVVRRRAGGRPRKRTRRKINTPIIEEPEEYDSKPPRRVAAKRLHRRRKDSKSQTKEGEKAGLPVVKKRPGRKLIQYPVEIPPELLKKPREKIEYHCSVCGKEFPHAYKLERHELIHTGEKPYCCSICGRGFNQKGNLKTHYKVHLGRKGALEFEDEVNPIASELSEYLRSLPGESKIRTSLRCLECGKECDSQSALQAHHITTHTGTPREPDPLEMNASQFLFCHRCGVQFSEKDKLEEHMKTHIKEKRFSCPDCGKRFINESYIQVHQRIHTGEKPFLCSQCGRGFHTASSLKLHEMQHTGERPYACGICGKKFRINSYLTAHYQTHIIDRPFICSVCGKGYARAEELKVHHRLHTGERPYACEECGKSFIYRQGLRQHQRTHAGRRIGPTRQLGRPKQEATLDI